MRRHHEDPAYQQEQQLRECEYQRERGTQLGNAGRTQQFKTRSQWREAGRMVFVPNSEARKSVIAKIGGHVLFLFDESQTRERTPAELLRDCAVSQ